MSSKLSTFSIEKLLDEKLDSHFDKDKIIESSDKEKEEFYNLTYGDSWEVYLKDGIDDDEIQRFSFIFLISQYLHVNKLNNIKLYDLWLNLHQTVVNPFFKTIKKNDLKQCYIDYMFNKYKIDKTITSSIIDWIYVSDNENDQVNRISLDHVSVWWADKHYIPSQVETEKDEKVDNKLSEKVKPTKSSTKKKAIVKPLSTDEPKEEIISISITTPRELSIKNIPIEKPKVSLSIDIKAIEDVLNNTEIIINEPVLQDIPKIEEPVIETEKKVVKKKKVKKAVSEKEEPVVDIKIDEIPLQNTSKNEEPIIEKKVVKKKIKKDIIVEEVSEIIMEEPIIEKKVIKKKKVKDPIIEEEIIMEEPIVEKKIIKKKVIKKDVPIAEIVDEIKEKKTIKKKKVVKFDETQKEETFDI